MTKWKEWLFKGGAAIDSSMPDVKQEIPKSGGMTRTGECSHCGKCCLRSGGVMVENPMIERTEDRCKFYVDTVNDKQYGHCLVYGRGGKPIKSIKDRYGKTITDEQIKWFNANCIEYPRVKDAEAGVLPPEGCGFSFEEVI